jgi:hypothetical protein
MPAASTSTPFEILRGASAPVAVVDSNRAAAILATRSRVMVASRL